MGKDVAGCPVSGPQRYLQDPDFTLWLGDVRDVLPRLEAESVDCALTSPPFYGLRDYGVNGQIGLEASPDEWCSELVAVFREVRRLLKPQGTLWVECGDSYASNWPCNRRNVIGEGSLPNGKREARAPRMGGDLKEKDLIGAPWLLAFALRADGWYLRQCIIWQKSNPMPESIRDRCTTAHSYLFLLSKQPRYFFDAEAIAEPAEWARWGDQTVPKYEGTETASGWMQPKTKAELVARGGRTTNGHRERSTEMRGFDNRLERADGRKNARSVWSIPTEGYPGAHFATWPQALVERIIKAGCPEWVCKACGKPRERLQEISYIPHGDPLRQNAELRANAKAVSGQATHQGPQSMAHGRATKITETTGWSDCGCGAGFTPGVCLDPFMGSGTTALVARRLGRHAVGIELSAEYAAMAARRTQQLSVLA
jgi:DNA modification methylase